MPLLPVDEAVSRLLAGVTPLENETASLADAVGRVLGADLPARRTQPPFDASAMDGYAVRSADAAAGSNLRLIGESRAGLRFAASIGAGEAVRIFTGAPVPPGADAILIQENALLSGDIVQVREPPATGRFIRRAGLDFETGSILLRAGQVLGARAISLAAAMGYAELPVRRRPIVAILSNGDELVPPGAEAGPDQIISSNGAGLVAFVRGCGGEPLDLGIAADNIDTIAAFVDQAAGADILVVIGGASVGDHDLVKPALAERGMELDFWKIAMRPGKPLMVGSLGAMRVLGLPGNPVSALVCSHVFLKPLLAELLGMAPVSGVTTAVLGADMPANDERQDFVRARLERSEAGLVTTPFPVQDSSMLSVLAEAGALIIRAPHAAPSKAGETVRILPL